MKKLLWVAVILLTLVLSIIYRQLTAACHRKACLQKPSVPILVQENLILGSLLIQ